MGTDVRQCWQCGEFYPLHIAYFRRKKINSTGFAGNCRRCTNGRKRDLRALKKASAAQPSKPTPAERHKAYRTRKKLGRFAKLTEGLR